jgi:hypothetical protein
MSPTPSTGGAKVTDPGSWNRYSHVDGDPTNGRSERGAFLSTRFRSAIQTQS